VKSLINSPDTPDFLLKSTQWVSIVSTLILTPFTVNNFLQGRYVLGFFALLIAVLCNINAWFCYRGHYKLGLNLFVITPVLMLAILFILNELAVVGCFWAYLMVIAFYFILPEKHAWITKLPA
jgi:diguanylate cyclase